LDVDNVAAHASPIVFIAALKTLLCPATLTWNQFEPSGASSRRSAMMVENWFFSNKLFTFGKLFFVNCADSSA